MTIEIAWQLLAELNDLEVRCTVAGMRLRDDPELTELQRDIRAGRAAVFAVLALLRQTDAGRHRCGGVVH